VLGLLFDHAFDVVPFLVLIAIGAGQAPHLVVTV